MKEQIGTLYGIGVGPGDPELLTLQATRILGRVDMVFAAASTRNDSSLALDIARPHLREDAQVVCLGFPMTRNKAELQEAWEANARTVLDTLGQGRDAAFLTLGDPLLYSTFIYLKRTLEALAPGTPIRSVPGITSYQAAAARTGTVLAESGQNLLVLSGVSGTEELRRHLECADNAAVLKAYKNFAEIRDLVRELGLDQTSQLVTRLGLEGEAVYKDLDQAPDQPHYFSLLLVKKPD